MRTRHSTFVLILIGSTAIAFADYDESKHGYDEYGLPIYTRSDHEREQRSATDSKPALQQSTQAVTQSSDSGWGGTIIDENPPSTCPFTQTELDQAYARASLAIKDGNREHWYAAVVPLAKAGCDTPELREQFARAQLAERQFVEQRDRAARVASSRADINRSGNLVHTPTDWVALTNGLREMIAAAQRSNSQTPPSSLLPAPQSATPTRSGAARVEGSNLYNVDTLRGLLEGGDEDRRPTTQQSGALLTPDSNIHRTNGDCNGETLYGVSGQCNDADTARNCRFINWCVVRSPSRCLSDMNSSGAAAVTWIAQGATRDGSAEIGVCDNGGAQPSGGDFNIDRRYDLKIISQVRGRRHDNRQAQMAAERAWQNCNDGARAYTAQLRGLDLSHCHAPQANNHYR